MTCWWEACLAPCENDAWQAMQIWENWKRIQKKRKAAERPPWIAMLYCQCHVTRTNKSQSREMDRWRQQSENFMGVQCLRHLLKRHPGKMCLSDLHESWTPDSCDTTILIHLKDTAPSAKAWDKSWDDWEWPYVDEIEMTSKVHGMYGVRSLESTGAASRLSAMACRSHVTL